MIDSATILADMKRLYLFTFEISPVEVDRTYDELPSHLTLMSRFLSELNPEELDRAVRPVFDRVQPISIVFGLTTELGPKKLVVHMVDYSSRLQKLHSSILKLLMELNAELQYPQFVGNRHKPHVTRREAVNFPEGTTLTVNTVCLIEVVGGRRTIRAKYRLV